ncbi:MAG: SUMF1/EgtB/PvdO family nonheme iron enzyme [Planctomycetota bacterium]|jgi:hypothetical protein
MSNKSFVLITVSVLLVSFNSVSAITWTNASPGNDSWCVAGNWDLGRIPNATDTAVISTPYLGPVIDCNVTVANINGPMYGVSSNQVMDVNSGNVVINGAWVYRTGTGTATINIRGSSSVTIENGGWRAPDNGIGIVNITGSPTIIVQGAGNRIKGGDGTTGKFYLNISGGYIECPILQYGDDGGGELNLSDGYIYVTENMDLGGARGTVPIIVNMTGGFIEIVGALLAPANATRAGAVTINLHGGAIQCGSFTHAGVAYLMDITEGSMTISGDVRAGIQSDVTAGYITAYGGAGSVNIDLVSGNTIVSATSPDAYIASKPSPPDQGPVFTAETTLGWKPGIHAVKHDVYLGTAFSDVNDASDPNVLPGRGRQDSNTYHAQNLQDGTYYWRIDEVSGPSKWKGKVWSFTVVESYTNSIGMLFIKVPAGTFTMGQGDGHSIQDSNSLDYDEQPAHPVKISKAFYMLMTPVSQTHYQQSGLPGSASDVSWDDANAFGQWLSNLEGKTYRLPTEAEWEYVCENPRGVQDVNSREWVQDWHGNYVNDGQVDPVGPVKGILKVIRADGQNRWALETNSRYQTWQLGEAPACGFRLVLETEAPLARYSSPGPFCQAAVKQSTSPALQGPNPNVPYFTVRFALPIPPDNITEGIASLLGCDPATMYHNHSPGFEIMPNGDAIAVYGTANMGPSGVSEYGGDTRFVQARLRYGSDQWDMPELFWDMKGMNDGSGLLWTENNGTVHFFGGGRIANSDKRPLVMANSSDSGATWTLKRPIFPGPVVNYQAQPVTNAWRQNESTIYTVTDAENPSSTSMVWRSTNNGLTWYDMGGRTNGRHSTIISLDNSGTLLSYGGKNSNIDGWMGWCASYDWGATWPDAGPSPFAVLGGNQRPNLITLANGNLVMVGDCQKKNNGYQPPGWTLGYGCYVAVSDDDGDSWHFKKFPVTLPHESDTPYGTLGYTTVRQAPNGVIHVLTTMTHPCLHYEFNEEWIYSGDGDITPETTGGTVNQYSEYYPGGPLKAAWLARTCPNGRYLLHGTETSYYPDGKKEHQVTYNNGRKTGTETFWAPDGVKLWSWQHDDVNNISLWSNYWSNGLKRIESRWNSYPTARDLLTRNFSGFVAEGTTYHWNRSGQPAKAYSFSEGNYLGETSLPPAQTKGTINFETFVRNWLWMGFSGGDGYNEADLNKDGVVNFADFAAFASQ